MRENSQKKKFTFKKIKFSKQEIDDIAKKLIRNLKKSIDIAFKRIKLFHSKQKFTSYKYRDKYNNELSYRYLPLEKVRFMFQEERLVTQALF